jgi:hypothetical protein
MRKVRISHIVWDKLETLTDYLVDELKLSEQAAMRRIDSMLIFLKSLNAPADHSLCRFKKWNVLGYRCITFEKTWVFAYEIIDNGVIVRDMENTALLIE